MIDELSLGYTKELQQDAAATGTPRMKLSVCKCQAHMGAPTPSSPPLRGGSNGGSLTRYRGNLFTTVGRGRRAVQLDHRIKTRFYDP